MFDDLRRRLLLTVLLLLASVLSVFAIAVRILFVHMNGQQLNDRLASLTAGAAGAFELEQGKPTLSPERSEGLRVGDDQGLEWYALSGSRLRQDGRVHLALPLTMGRRIQIQDSHPRIMGFTTEARDPRSGRILGYVRSSQSLEEVDESIRLLDWGMAGGIAMALVISGAGGFIVMRQVMQPIEASYALQRQFSTDAAHEFRGPLMAIQANAQVALKYAAGMRPGDAEKFQVIEKAARQLSVLADDLLFLTRKNGLDPFILFDFSSLLQELCALYAPVAAGRSIRLELQTSGVQQVSGDPVQLRRVVTNLIDNALRFTPSGGDVWITSEPIGDHVQLEIRDTGIGMEKDQLARIFDRFWQADPARSDATGGCGLGLAIVRSIVTQHGGSIAVESQPGVGSRFRITLPASRSRSGRG